MVRRHRIHPPLRNPMARRQKVPTFASLAAALEEKFHPPLGVVLGSRKEVVDCLQPLALDGATCYQMDLHQGARLEQVLAEAGVRGSVVVAPDLWDIETPFRTLVYPVPQRGERILKLDMLEQAFHALE